MNSNPDPLLRFSPRESEVLGLRIARSGRRLQEVPVEILRREISAGEFDLCKLKVRADQPGIFRQLEELGFPFQMTSILYRNVKEITREDGNYLPPEGISYEPFDGSQRPVLGPFVEDAFGNPTGVNFEIWPFKHLISPEKEMDLARAYALGFTHEDGKKDLAWLLKDRNQYVGFFMGIFEEDHFEGTLYGVPPQHRGKGYGKVIYDLMKKICYERGAKYFFTDVQLQNAASQASTLHGGLRPSEFYFHFFLGSFLHSRSDPGRNQPVSGMTPKDILATFQDVTGQGKLPREWRWIPFSGKSDWERLKVYSPFSDPESSLWCGKLLGPEGQLIAMIQARYMR